MITLIILIGLVALGAYMIDKSYNSFNSNSINNELLGIIICLISGTLLVLHSMFWFPVTYQYELFVHKRNAFEQTLKDVRENGNQYATAAIVKEVVQWNVELSKYKYNNKTFILDQYIDDRIELLEPIR